MEDGDLGMSSIDERIVEMQFKNQQFESGVSTTMNTLDKLKQKLQFKNTDGNIDQLAKSFQNFGGSTLSTVASSVQALANRFSTFGIIGMTAIQNITNAAMGMGKQLLEAVSFNAIKDGFNEYETQMNAIQTILSNTRSEGTTIDQVNSALDELNRYADLTIYNFTEMTRNIGTFTAAGVDLKTSVNAIQGIANLAAVSGSTSNQASVAMYQLSQALATGTVKLMDWNSVVNAGMGGQVFQDALIKTSKELNTGAEAAIKAKGSFRESLQTGWLTSQVLTETLKKFTTSGAMEWVANYCDVSQDAVQAAYDQAYAASNAETSFAKQQEAIDAVADSLANQTGKSKDAIKETLELAYDAQNAATKVKTFSQLIDTLTEALGSGWTKSWQIIIGDFEEARELWTSVSDILSNMINLSADARNAMLQSWSDMGGRTALIQSFSNVFDALLQVMRPIKEAFSDIFPPMTAEKLYNLTIKLRDFTAGLKLSSEQAGKVKTVFTGLFSGVRLIGKVIGFVANSLKILLSAFSPLLPVLENAIIKFSEFLTKLNSSVTPTNIFTKFVEWLSSSIHNIITNLINLNSKVDEKFSSLPTIFSKVFEKIKTVFNNFITWMKGTISKIQEGLTMKEILKTLGKVKILGLLTLIATSAKKAIELILNVITNFIGPAKEKMGSFGDIFKDMLGNVTDTLEEATNTLKVGQVVALAGAIWIMADALAKLSNLSVGDSLKSIASLSGILVILFKGLKKIIPELNNFNKVGGTKAALMMLTLAESAKILSEALVVLSGLDILEIAQGVAGLYGLMYSLTLAINKLDDIKVSAGTILETIVLAQSVSILVKTLKTISDLNLTQIATGLAGLGGTLAELVMGLKILDDVKISFGTILETITIATSLLILTKVLKNLAEFSWDDIWTSLTTMGLALSELVVSIRVLAKVAGKSSGALASATSILMIVVAMKGVAKEFSTFAYMSWDEILRGLAGFGGVLVELGTVETLMGRLGGFATVIAGIGLDLGVLALKGIADVFMTMAYISQDQVTTVGDALTAMLIKLAAIQACLGELSGFGALIGGLSLDVAVLSLKPVAEALKSLAGYSWDQLETAGDGLARCLTNLAIITTISGLAEFASLMGAIGLDVAVLSLKPVAEALKSLAGYSWDQLETASDGIARCMTQLALISGITGLGGVFGLLGGAAVAQMANNLKPLAEGLKTFISIGDVPEDIFKPLEKLGDALGHFDWHGWGADTIATLAKPIGDLADSMKKWSDVNIPEALGSQLQSLSFGVSAFNFAGWGADAIGALAGPLSQLAGSISNWEDVSINPSLSGQLQGLAEGVFAFNFTGWGASNISELAGPIGQLAGSISNWEDVSINPSLPDQLSALARGICAFNFSGWGADSIASLANSLGPFASGIKQFPNSSVLSNLEEPLTGLARGIGSFFGTGFAAGDLEAISGPFANFSDSIRRWIGIEGLPDGEQIKTLLTNIAQGLLNFEGKEGIADTMATVSDAISQLGLGFIRLNNTDWQAPLDNLKNFVDTLNNGIPELTSTLSEQIDTFSTNVVNSLTNFGNNILSTTGTVTNNINTVKLSVENALTGLDNALSSHMDSMSTSASSKADNVINAFNRLVSGASSAASNISSSVNQISGSVTAAMRDSINAINEASSQFENAGKNIPTRISSGISQNADSVSNSAKAAVSSAISSASNETGRAESIGYYISAGLASGIRSGRSSVISAAVSVAADAINAAKNAAGVASPSKKTYAIARFCILGAINGLRDNKDRLISTFRTTMTDALEVVHQVATDLSTSMTPKITPVVDMDSATKSISAFDGSMARNKVIDFVSNAKAQAVSASFKGKTEIETDYQKAIIASNDKVAGAIADLRTDMAGYTESINNSETAMYLDGKKLASSIAKSMNKELGVLSKRGGLA